MLRAKAWVLFHRRRKRAAEALRCGTPLLGFWRCAAAAVHGCMVMPCGTRGHAGTSSICGVRSGAEASWDSAVDRRGLQAAVAVVDPWAD